jgi:hypothetical protein
MPKQDCFDFLGYAFGPHHDERGGERHLGASQSKKSVRRIKSMVSELLVPREKTMARRARATKPAIAGLVGVIQLRYLLAGLSGGRLSRL